MKNLSKATTELDIVAMDLLRCLLHVCRLTHLHHDDDDDYVNDDDENDDYIYYESKMANLIQSPG